MSITRFNIKFLSIQNAELLVHKSLSYKIHVINLNDIDNVYVKSNIKKSDRLLIIMAIRMILCLLLALSFLFSFSFFLLFAILFFLLIIFNYRNYFIIIQLKDKSIFKLFFSASKKYYMVEKLRTIRININ